MATERGLGYSEGRGASVAGLEQDGKVYQSVVLNGVTDAGSVQAIPVTPEGHLEVAIHDPILPFGEVSVESLTPVFQIDAVYGINPLTVATSSDGVNGTATAASNLFSVSTGGTTVGNYAAIQSKNRLRYRPGQGVVGRFTALFTTGVANAVQVAGYGTGESGCYFGYNGTSFGILTNTSGVRAIYTLTVTTASTSTNNYNVELNGVTTNVTATNNGSTAQTAYEISRGTYNGWKAEQVGSTVVFLSDAVGAKAGAFSLAQASAGTPAAGSYATTLAGVAVTDTWVPQASWNGDTLDGSGDVNNPSGVLLDPTKGNVYSIGIQYLGFGAITFRIEVISPDGNNATFETVHTIRFPNTATAVSLRQPSFPFTMSAANVGTAGGTVTVKTASFAGFVAGVKQLTGPRMSYYNSGTSSTTVFVPLFTVRNNFTYGTRANQAVLNALSVSGAARGGNNSLTSFYLVRNATLSTGSPAFALFSSGRSCTAWDSATTAVTWATNDQVVWVGTVAESGQFQFGFTSDQIELQPGETLTLCCKTSGGTAGAIFGSLNTREDQ